MFETVTPPTAKSLILDLLSTLRGRSMPVRALIDAARLFDIGDNNVRVSLARLCSAGVVEHDERGLYRLGDSSAAVERQITSWRRLEDRVREWDGGWIGVLGAASARRPAGRRTAHALRFLGFRGLSPLLSVRPDNLAGGVSGTRRELLALGLDPNATIFGMRDLDPERDRQARRLWNRDELLARYSDYCALIAASRMRLPSLTRDQAMLESFLLGGSVLRELVLDPLLPEPILPAGPRNELVAAMRDYDRVGRAAWADFLRDHGVVHSQSPADLRVGQAESRFTDFSNTGAST
jgi:phenylacetic acid degradation operon negative regulatory protein